MIRSAVSHFGFAIFFIWMCSAVVFLSTAVASDLEISSSRQSSTPKNVLFISSFRHNIPAQAEIEKGLKQFLLKSSTRINVSFESLGSPVSTAQDMDPVFIEYLNRKYLHVQFDVVIGWSTDAYKIIKNNPGLFASSRHIYFGILDGLPLAENEVRIPTYRDYLPSLKDAIALVNPQHLVIVGESRDLIAMRSLKSTQSALEAQEYRHIHVEYIIDLPLDDLNARLAKLPTGSMVFYLLMSSDGKGGFMAPYDVVKILSQHSAAPIFSHWESLMGSGIVGGYQLSLEKIGDSLGKSIINTEATPKTLESSMRRVYDWDQLKKWNIDVSLLAKDSTFINRPPSVLETYKTEFLFACVFIGVLILLSFYLWRVIKMRNAAISGLANHRAELADTIEIRTKEVLKSRRDLMLVLEATGDGIYGVDLEGKTTFINPVARKLFGVNEIDVIDRVHHDLHHHSYEDGTPLPKEDCKIYLTLKDGKVAYVADEVFWRKDGSSFPVEYIATPVIEEDVIVGAVVSFRDITLRRQAEREVKLLATTDSLTGLANRNLFTRRLNDAMALAERQNFKVGLLALDLDDFKAVNDQYGHPGGDALLKEVAARLLQHFRSSDTVARVGGDEFSIVMTGVEDKYSLESLVKRIIASVSKPVQLDAGDAAVGVSIGIAYYPDHGQTPEALIKKADEALYRAKKSGKNTFQLTSG